MCFGPLEVAYDYELIGNTVTRASIAAGPKSLWRYKAMLPIESDRYVDSQAGFTPLVRAHNLGKLLGLNNVYVKSNTVNPTSYFKDRPNWIAPKKEIALGFDALA